MKNVVKGFTGFVVGVIYMGVPTYLGWIASRFITKIYYKYTSDKFNKFYQKIFDN